MEYGGNYIFQKNSVLKIDASAIAHNLNIIRSKVQCQLIAVIKENGYGMGLLNEYTLLKNLGMNYFAVTNVKEALALRKFGCEDPVILMIPVFNVNDCLALVEANIIFMLGSEEQAKLLQGIANQTQTKPRVHLKIETGMGRYGFHYKELPDFNVIVRNLQVEGCYTHLGGKPKHYKKEAYKQANRFLQAIHHLESQGIKTGMKHISNSAATMSLGDFGMDAVRVGSALIGKSALGGSQLKTAVWLETRVYQKIPKKKGDTIGYQSTAVLKKDSVLGLLPVGHGDGIYLGYSDTKETFFHGIVHSIALLLLKKRYRKTVIIGERRIPIVGRLGIAHTMVDLTGQDIQVGDVARISVNPLLVHPAVPKEIINIKE